MTTPPPVRSRSLALVVACALAGLSALYGAAFAYDPPTRALAGQLGAPWFPLFRLLTSVLALAAVVTLWLHRRWGLLVYLAVVGVQMAVFAVLGVWSPRFLLVPALVGGAAAWSWDRLR